MRKKLLVLTLIITLTVTMGYKKETRAAGNFDCTKNIVSYDEPCPPVIDGIFQDYNVQGDTVTGIENENIYIAFEYYGIPEPQPTVYRGYAEDVITSGQRYDFFYFNDMFVFVIKKSKPSDEGLYKLVMENQHGFDQREFYVKINSGE